MKCRVAHPLMVVLAIAATACTAAAQVKVSRQAGGAIVLENPALRVRIEPAQGGAVTELLHKPSGKNLAGNYVGERPAQGFGLLLDRFWPKSGGQVRDLEARPYAVAVSDPDAEHPAARVTLAYLCDQASAKGLRVEKTVLLRPDAACLDVEYAVSNMGQTPQITRFWSANVLRPDGPKSEKLTYFSPGPTGVVAHTYDPKTGPSENVWVVLQRDWRAVIGQSGAGAAAIVDSAIVEKAYSYFPPTSAAPDYATFEWLFQSVELKPLNPPEGDINPGRPFRTRMAFVPFVGLKAVHGASRDFVGEIEVGGREAVVRLASAVSVQAEVVLSARSLPSRTASEVGKQTVELRFDRAVEARFALPALGEGSHVLTCKVSALGREPAVLERLHVVGKPSGDYAMARFGPKAPEPVPDIPTTVSTEVESPHVKWAKPYAGGKLRALFVLPHRSLREAVEVWQRTDLDFAVVPTISVTDLEAAGAKPQVLDRKMLDLLAQEWDVIVFGATYWRPWPQPVQQALAEKVAAGTGFVYVWPYGDYFARTMKGMRETRAEESFVRDALPMKLIPPWDKLEPAGMVRLHEHAKGRVALLDYPVLPDSRGIRAKSPGGLTPRNPITDASFPFWEYHHSLLAKAMIWSSRRMPDARIVSLQADPAQSPVEARASVALVGNLRNDADRVRDLKAHVWAHDEMGERLETTPVAVSAAARKETAFLVRLPVARHSGPHLATVWLREGDKTLDWATVSFQVDGPVRMEKVGDLPAVVSEGDWVEAKAKVTAGRRVPVTVHAEIRDSLGRLLAEERQEVVLKAGEQEVSAGLSPTRAVIGRHRLNLTLLMGDARLARLSLPFGVDCRRYDDYVSILWGAGDGSYTQPVMQRVIAETESFDAVVTGAGRAGAYEHSEAFAEAVSASGLGVYAINLYHLSCKEAGLIRKPCLTNPEDRKAIRRDIREKGDWLARFAPLAYLLGDEMSLGPENGFTDFCQSPTCLAGFRRYLEDAYGRVGRLNAAWKTKFDSFDDAQPLTFSDAQRSGNYAPWADHRAYMDKVYARAFVLARDALAKRDPRPMVGYSGGGTWNIAVNGYNRWELYQVCKAVTDYGPDTPDILRSFMSGDHIGSWWWGMYDGGPENARRHTPWGLILRGLNGSGFYCAYGAGHSLFSDYGLLDPGFVPKKNVVADLREDVKPLREGLGKLLLSSRRLNSGIAIHYSQPCVRAAYVANEKPVDERLWNRARWGMEIALKDLGLSYDLISPAQIEEGRLEDFRVLVLPLSQALSEDEADQIARFVRRGGALLADPLAGRFDEHLVPQSPRRLEEVLGVSGGSPSVVRGEVGFQEKSPILAGGTLATTVLCRDVRARGAAVWANLSPSDIPAVLYRAHGKGAAYTLNFTFAQYVDARASERGQDFAEFLDGLLARHDVRPDVRVLKGGQRERGVEVSIFESGKTAFIGLLQDSEVKPIAGDEARIQFTRFGRLYDVRARQYVGEQSMLVTEFRPCRGRLFALLPEQPPRPAVTAPAKPVKAGQPVEVRVQQPTKARFGRVIRVEVAAPDGKPRPYYARNLFSLDGDCRVAIPLALNDPAGEWVVTARDVVTGETGEATFRYGPPAP